MTKFFTRLQPLVKEIRWAKYFIILARWKDPILPKSDSKSID